MKRSQVLAVIFFLAQELKGSSGNFDEEEGFKESRSDMGGPNWRDQSNCSLLKSGNMDSLLWVMA